MQLHIILHGIRRPVLVFIDNYMFMANINTHQHTYSNVRPE